MPFDWSESTATPFDWFEVVAASFDWSESVGTPCDWSELAATALDWSGPAAVAFDWVVVSVPVVVSGVALAAVGTALAIYIYAMVGCVQVV